MSVTIHHCDQRSDEWLALRAGILTGTGATAMLAKARKKGEESYQRRDVRLQLVCERLTGRSLDDGFDTVWVRKGREREPLAVAAYEAVTGSLVASVGFVRDDTCAMGCSPDGLVEGGAGLLEIKCPKPATHLKYLREGRLPPEYEPQVRHTALVTGVQWVDFVSWCEEFPAALQLFVCRIKREDLALGTYYELAVAFLDEVDAEFAAVQTMSERAQVA